MFWLAGVLLLLLLTCQLTAQAKLPPREGDAPSSQRTLFSIIWGCVSTTIICAWAAIHPNIPPREGPFKGVLRRLELMFWTILAPEILPCWALNQLLAAMTVRDVYNDGKGYEKKRRGIWEAAKGLFSLNEIQEAGSPAWTVAHGHFLIMGGFHVVEPHEEGRSLDSESTTGVLPTSALDTEKRYAHSENKPETELKRGREMVLTLEMLRELVKDPEFKIQITEEQITHTSKGDALSKFIFVMQSTWFIVQCLGRRVQGLDLTQLELTTLALASLNGITFLLWWDKPLGAQSIVLLYLKRKLTDSEQVRVRRSVQPVVIPSLREIFDGCVTRIRDAILCQSKLEELVLLPFAILFLLLLPFFAFTFAFGVTVDDLLGASTMFPADNTHVPTFYVPRHRYSEWCHLLLLVTLGTTFGAIHCFGWNFPFPTGTEQKLWRVASLAVTLIPIAILPFVLVLNFISTCRLPTLETSIPTSLTFVLCTLAYVVARLVLLVLALALLRHLPPTVFIAIDWTKFYPHII